MPVAGLPNDDRLAVAQSSTDGIISQRGFDKVTFSRLKGVLEMLKPGLQDPADVDRWLFSNGAKWNPTSLRDLTERLLVGESFNTQDMMRHKSFTRSPKRAKATKSVKADKPENTVQIIGSYDDILR